MVSASSDTCLCAWAKNKVHIVAYQNVLISSPWSEKSLWYNKKSPCWHDRSFHRRKKGGKLHYLIFKILQYGMLSRSYCLTLIHLHVIISLNVTQLQHHIIKPCDGLLKPPKVILKKALLDVAFNGLLWCSGIRHSEKSFFISEKPGYSNQPIQGLTPHLKQLFYGRRPLGCACIFSASHPHL